MKKKKKNGNQMSFESFFSTFLGGNTKTEEPKTNGSCALKTEPIAQQQVSITDLLMPIPEEVQDIVNVEEFAIEEFDIDMANFTETSTPQSDIEYVAPANAENYTLGEEEKVSKAQKYINNIEAIKVIKSLAGKVANKIQQTVIAKFVGFGGFPNAFKPGTEEAEELHVLLNEDEFASARKTTLTAFYTPKAVIDAIYAALRKMGFRGGNILEPSCGSGKFIGAIPEDMPSSVTAIELDKLTASVAQLLYPKAHVINKGFEEVQLPDNYFDLAISNVPFGDIKLYDPEYHTICQKGFSIHEYFLAKMLDKVHPGGLVAIVLSTYFMDSVNSVKRRYVAQRAELLTAIRLPSGVFGETETPADVLFFKKRPEIIEDVEDAWIGTSKFGKGIEENDAFSFEEMRSFYSTVNLYSWNLSGTANINNYFIVHPEHILGRIRFDSNQYGQEVAIYCGTPENLAVSMFDFVPRNVFETWNGTLEIEETIPDGVIPNTFYMYNGNIWFADGTKPVLQQDSNKAMIIELIKLRTVVQKLLVAQKEGENIEHLRKQLNARYDAFVSKYDRINSPSVKKVFSEDYSYAILSGLERYDENHKFVGKSAIMTEQTTYTCSDMYEKEENAENALIKSLRYFAKVNLSYISEIMGKELGEVIALLKGKIFLNPETKTYETADEYLSGNVRKKLQIASEQALENKALEDNVEALKKALPPEVLPCDIEIALGTKWVPTDIYLAFAKDIIAGGENDANVNIVYSPKTVTFKVTSNSWISNESINTRWGVKGSDVQKTGYDLLDDCLNNRDSKLYMPGKNKENKDTRVIDPPATKEAQLKQNEMRNAFAEWVVQDEERMNRLASIYNAKFNSYVVRQYDGSFLEFPEMTPDITLKKHQVDAVARILLHGNALLAQVVGAGKTYICVASAMEGKRLGLFQKPLFVVPKHLVAQWQGDFTTLYPNSNVVCADEKSFSKENRAKFISKIALNNYDAIIMSYEQFSNITLSKELQAQYIEQDIAEMQDYLASMTTEDKQEARYSIKEVEKQINNLENRLKATTQEINKKKEFIDFELLGIDKIFVDEAHYYKNLRVTTKLGRIKGVQTTAALKTDRFYNIVRYMNDTYNERALVFATATPISNSITELYTMMKYLEPSVLEDFDCIHFDEWATTFGKIETQLELDPNGSTFRSVQKFAKFFNLPELIVAFHQVADVKLAEDIDVPLPKAEQVTVENELSDFQDEYMQSLVERSDRIRSGGVDPSEDNMLLVTGDGKKLSIDPRILDSNIEVDDSTSKLSLICKNVYKEYVASNDIKGTQMIFLDCSTPSKEKKWTMYQAIKENLVDSGIPSEQIAFIHNADTKAKKDKLFKQVNEGTVRVLLGSTTKMGTGVNAQERMVAIHHADVPWRPADIEQRNGRGIRRGNINKTIRIYRYITKGSFDARAWQTVEDKQKFIGSLMRGHKAIGRSIDGDLFDEATLSYGEIKACALKDPRIKEYFELENELNVLRVKRSSEKHQLLNLRNKLRELPQKIEKQKAYIEKIDAFLDIVKANYVSDFGTNEKGEKLFACTIKGINYDNRVEAAAALGDALKQLPYNGQKEIVGNYRGMDLVAVYNSFMNYYSIGITAKVGSEYFVVYAEENNYTTNLKHQIWMKIDNIFQKVPDLKENGERRLKISQENLASVQAELDKMTGEDSVEELYNKKAAEFKRLGSELHIGEYINETAGLE